MPSRKLDVARVQVHVPGQGLPNADALRRARRTHAAAKTWRQARGELEGETIRFALQIEIDLVEHQFGQGGIPVLDREPAALNLDISGRQVVQGQTRRAHVLPSLQLDLGGEREFMRADARQHDVGLVQPYAAGEELAAAEPFADIRPDPAACRAGEDPLIVLGAQFQLVEIQLRSVPMQARSHMGEADIKAGLPVHPILDLGLVRRHPVERELQSEHQHQQQRQKAGQAVEQEFSELTQTHLHQHNIVLIDRIQGFRLQFDGPAGQGLELGQRGRSLVEQAFHDVRMGQHPQLPALGHARLAQDFTKYLVTNGFRRFHESATVAAWTRPA